ncbi:hypothetical protein QMA61_18195 [Streptomyces coelicoflavus]|uniref:hypothetical protein n=1 Tax=Streptomyces coelicoflavus TaxID=285562 RepID=UPI0024ADF17D|nr:hypothetical protein [Streptomyces coelicoflavus]MDI6518126.1 hypothetical protein [Streptomyces coelicoflavus]
MNTPPTVPAEKTAPQAADARLKALQVVAEALEPTPRVRAYRAVLAALATG